VASHSKTVESSPQKSIASSAMVSTAKKKNQKPVTYTEEEIEKLPFKCKFPDCPYRFNLCSALGGHISKAHPGQSQTYNHKKAVRDRRNLERLLHRETMEIYAEQEQDKEILS